MSDELADREELAARHVEHLFMGDHTDEIKALRDIMRHSFKAGFDAAKYDRPALAILSKLRFRAHREGKEALARTIGDLEYFVQNWHHIPSREAPLQ